MASLGPSSDGIEGFRCYICPPDACETPANVDTFGNRLFMIRSGYSGSDRAGILGYAATGPDKYAGRVSYTGTGKAQLYGADPDTNIIDYTALLHAPTNVLRLTSPWFAEAGQESGFGSRRIKITQDLLLDTRPNPFEAAEDDDDANEFGNYKRLREWANFGYIPCHLEALDSAGNVIGHYRNGDIMRARGRARRPAGESNEIGRAHV